MFIEKIGFLQKIPSNNFEAAATSRQDFAPISPLTSSPIIVNLTKNVKAVVNSNRVFAAYSQPYATGEGLQKMAINIAPRSPKRPPRHIRGCKSCGAIETKLGPGNQNRPVSLNCAACGQFWRWMGRLEFELYQRKTQKATAPRQLNIFEGGEGLL